MSEYLTVEECRELAAGERIRYLVPDRPEQAGTILRANCLTLYLSDGGQVPILKAKIWRENGADVLKSAPKKMEIESMESETPSQRLCKNCGKPLADGAPKQRKYCDRQLCRRDRWNKADAKRRRAKKRETVAAAKKAVSQAVNQAKKVLETGGTIYDAAGRIKSPVVAGGDDRALRDVSAAEQAADDAKKNLAWRSEAEKDVDLERMRIVDEVDEFCVAIRDRMLAKMDEGYSGWDDERICSTESLVHAAAADAERIRDERKNKCVDVAARMMMVWRRWGKSV